MTFIEIWKKFGLKVALSNALFVFTKWYLGAKRMKVTYGRQIRKKTNRKTVSK